MPLASGNFSQKSLLSHTYIISCQEYMKTPDISYLLLQCIPPGWLDYYIHFQTVWPQQPPVYWALEPNHYVDNVPNCFTVHVCASSLDHAHNRKCSKNSYFRWPQLWVQLTTSFNILPHLYIAIGLLKNAKKNVLFFKRQLPFKLIYNAYIPPYKILHCFEKYNTGAIITVSYEPGRVHI